MNCSCKLITKVLANCLKCALHSLISETHPVYVKDLHISNSILQSNEIIYGLDHRHLEGLVLKLDYEKAFDFIDWGFCLNANIG